MVLVHKGGVFMGNLFLTLGVFEWIGDKISSGFTFIMLLIDNVVYWFASQCYQLFIKLSMTRLFEDAFFSDFANRIYAILGVFMLFYLAYALLNALVDPDKLAKGDKSVSKLAMNFVVSLVILGFLPSIFNYAYRLQNFILSENVIGTLVFGDQSVSSNEDNMIKYGDALSFTILNTFINPDNYNVELSTNYNWWNLKQDILENSDYSHLPSLNKAIVYGANEITDEGVSSTTVYPEYKVILSTIVGIYLCYIMVSFVLDLGVRVVKLAFCQLIAPIPVLMRAMPSKKSSFDKWLKLTLSIYFEVFVRVGMIYLSVYFINAIMENNRLADIFFSGGIQGMLALVVIILGILTFAKQAPKMISDILGIDTGNMKLGIADKLKGNVLGKGMVGVGSAALGFVTGGLGGAAVGLVNGAGLSAAALGALNGWKHKGMQFNRQRQHVYSDMGLRGKAGWFGGRAYFDNLADKERKAVKESYIKGRESRVEKFENSKLFETKMKEYTDAQLDANRGGLSNAERNYNNAKKKYDENVSNRTTFESGSEYQGILSRFQNQANSEAESYMKQHLHEYEATKTGRAAYQEDKDKLIKSLQNKYAYEELQRLSQNGTISEAAQSYLNNVQNYQSDLDDLNQATSALNEAQKHLNDIDQAAARAKTIEFMSSKENADLDSSIKRYQSNVKAVTEANKEKELKKYLESDAGREAVATQKEAFAALEREKKGRPGPPPPSPKKP